MHSLCHTERKKENLEASIAQLNLFSYLSECILLHCAYAVHYYRNFSKCALTAPDWDAPAFQFGDYGAHGHSDWDGIKVRRMWCHSEDGRFRGFYPLSLHFDPVETSAKPHGSHDRS